MVAAGSITVAVRLRPPTSWEAGRLPEKVYDACIRGDGALSTPAKSAAHQSSLREIIQIIDDRVLTFDPEERDISRAFVERGFLPPGTKRYKDRRFIFDRVFGHEAMQQDVYQATAKPLLKNLMYGYNATIFAYGATGCGKTHTISGTDTDPGVIYLTMADLFQEIEDRREEYDIDVVVTFLEIYNEEIRDLLVEPGTPTPRGGLQIREDKTVKVVGLVELRPQNADEVKQIVMMGNTRRTMSPTHANETSSRSHAVLQVHVTQGPRTASLTEQRTMATLSIIDLAGSERAAATSNMGQRMIEGANINKSLLALGNCINALCESGGAVRHVPYRNSKLTRLLKFSLGGNCKTLMIVCVAPTSAHFDDTHNTLLYAERATKIKTKVVTRNVVNVDRHVGQYVEAINRLNLQVEELKAKLAGKRDAEAEKEKRKRREATQEVERAKGDMKMKAEQVRSAFVDGATCAGKVSVAEAKLATIRARLGELDRHSASSPLSADLEAERGLLRALAGPEEAALKPGSDLKTRVTRAGNSAAMFEATLKAVGQRRTEALDDVSVDNVQLDARWHRAEMERVRAEAKRDAVQEALEYQMQTVVGLVGLVGRCTVVLGQAGKMLEGVVEGSEGMEKAKEVAALLKSVAEGNDEAFKSFLGSSVAEYAVGLPPAADNFKSYSTSFGSGRISSGLAATTISSSTVTAQPLPSAMTKISRRSSSYGAAMSGSPLRKSSSAHTYRSPRRSSRASLSGAAPYRRVSDRVEKPKKKGVQWKDEVGQGDLDDGGMGPVFVVNVTAPASPGLASKPVVLPSSAPVSSTSSSTASASDSKLGAPSSLGATRRSPTPGGSESEWEDERTDDSFSFASSSNASLSLSAPTSGNRRRPRASRLDPSFLKSSRSRISALGSLPETDEEPGSPTPKRTMSPLTDRSMNNLFSPGGSSSESEARVRTPKKGKSSLTPTLGMSSLHLSKTRERHHSSPVRRVLPPATTTVGTNKAASRRRSNIGPVRLERHRRRSSVMLPMSPGLKGKTTRDVSGLGIGLGLGLNAGESASGMGMGRSFVSGGGGSARRAVGMGGGIESSGGRSPARRVKRPSLLPQPQSVVGSASRPSWRLRGGDPNTSGGDNSFRSVKPSWK